MRFHQAVHPSPKVISWVPASQIASASVSFIAMKDRVGPGKMISCCLCSTLENYISSWHHTWHSIASKNRGRAKHLKSGNHSSVSLAPAHHLFGTGIASTKVTRVLPLIKVATESTLAIDFSLPLIKSAILFTAAYVHKHTYPGKKSRSCPWHWVHTHSGMIHIKWLPVQCILLSSFFNLHHRYPSLKPKVGYLLMPTAVISLIASSGISHCIKKGSKI